MGRKIHLHISNGGDGTWTVNFQNLYLKMPCKLYVESALYDDNTTAESVYITCNQIGADNQEYTTAQSTTSTRLCYFQRVLNFIDTDTNTYYSSELENSHIPFILQNTQSLTFTICKLSDGTAISDEVANVLLHLVIEEN